MRKRPTRNVHFISELNVNNEQMNNNNKFSMLGKYHNISQK